MASYRMHPVSETMKKITLGRDTIGWCRKFENAWVATTRLGNGRGATASEAFQDMVRSRNNHKAQMAGYADARDMVEQRNAQVREHVAQVNADLAAAGLPMRMTVRRRGRGILV